MLLLIYCFTSMAYCFQNKVTEAKHFFQKAEELRKELWIKYYVSITLLTKAYIELQEWKSGLNRSEESLAEFSTTCKKLLQASQKVHCTKTEAYRFRAISLVLSGNPGKALRFFNKSIEFAQWYGARVELSRTYFELGKFLSGPHAGIRHLKGLSGKEYLEKARMMFEEMDLQWDLEEYEHAMKSF